MKNNSSLFVNRRAFLKEAGLSLNSTLILSHPMIRVLHRIRGNVRLEQTVGPFSPSSGSFENEVPDLTLDSYMGDFTRVKKMLLKINRLKKLI